MGTFFRISEIQYEISEIQYENMGIFSKNPRISYHINMSRKVLCNQGDKLEIGWKRFVANLCFSC